MEGLVDRNDWTGRAQKRIPYRNEIWRVYGGSECDRAARSREGLLENECQLDLLRSTLVALAVVERAFSTCSKSRFTLSPKDLSPSIEACLWRNELLGGSEVVDTSRVAVPAPCSKGESMIGGSTCRFRKGIDLSTSTRQVFSLLSSCRSDLSTDGFDMPVVSAKAVLFGVAAPSWVFT